MSNETLRYGITAPATFNFNLMQRQCAEEIDCIASYPVMVAVACSDAKMAAHSRGVCADFKAQFPNGLPRNRLFDNQLVRGMDPFVPVSNNAPLTLLHLVKSHQVFYAMGDAIATQYPEIIADRKLDVLYLASGAHLSPILTAMRLIDLRAIDQARFVYTDLNSHLARDIDRAVHVIADLAGIKFDSIRRNKNDVVIVYQGVPITFSVHLKNSKKELASHDTQHIDLGDCMSATEFNDADLIVLHDTYDVRVVDNADVFDQMHKFQLSAKDLKVRVVAAAAPSVPASFVGVTIDGPYGCSRDGEISGDNIDLAARLFSLAPNKSQKSEK